MSVKCISVDYRNTLPLRAGLIQMVEAGELEMSLAHPREATRQFAAGQHLLGLLPAAAKLIVPEASFVGDFGIVADGFVGSVGIFSCCPLEEIEILYLDHDSRSSVLLAQILLKYHWRLSPKLVFAPKGYRSLISGKTAGVIIGDPAIKARSENFTYTDLGEAWKEMTGLPFVFATWISGIPLPANFIRAFDEAQSYGMSLRATLAEKHQYACPNYDLKDYFFNQIHYRIDEQARKGLELFLFYGKELIIETRPQYATV